MSPNTEQLLKDYHDASRRLEVWLDEPSLDEEFRKDHARLIASARELMSRCILSGDPRSLIALMQEMEYVLRIVGELYAADHVNTAGRRMATNFQRLGHFGT